MRVLLINPPYSTEERYGKDMGRFGPLTEPLGLAYIAANLEKAGHEVKILDSPALGISCREIPPVIEEGGYPVVGVTMLTPMYNRSMEVIRTLRQAFPGIVIVVGGAHPTILPEDTLRRNPEIDFAAIGEGEGVMRALVHALEKGAPVTGIPGLAYRRDREVHIHPPEAPLADLDDLPPPARHLLPMDAYRITRSRSQSSHAFTVSVARGCPFDCAFCCRIFGRKVRHHSVGRILEEVRTLVEIYGAKEINLEADTLTINKTFLLSLCDGLQGSGLAKRITWTCESRVDTVNADLLKRMKEAGCWQVSYGVETGTQRLLDLIHKGITLEQIEKTFALTKKVGISIRAFYMLGLPTETREESLKTISFARRLDAEWSQFTVFTPFPGTELQELAMREGGRMSRDWSDYKTHGGWAEGGLAYVPRGRSMEEMKSLQKKAYRALYMRPRVVLRFLKKVDSFQKLRVFASGFWVLMKSALPGSGSRGKGAVRIGRADLRGFAEGVYVDSPVYFAANPLVRWLNWRKLDAALSWLPREHGHRALDFCCGNGVLLPSLSREFRDTVAVDVHLAAAARVRRHFLLQGVSLLCADGRMLPLKESSFDLVFALSALEHFRELDGVVSELHRVLKPGGVLLFLSPTENLFYRIGRALLGYKKPDDHYHSAERIEAVLRRSLFLESARHLPWRALPCLSTYRLARFRKGSEGIGET